MDGHKCINENVIMYSELDQKLLKDVGGCGRRSFGDDARCIELDKFTEGEEEAVDQHRGRLGGAVGGTDMVDVTSVNLFLVICERRQRCHLQNN